MPLIDLSRWFLVPGPEFNPPTDSLGQYHIECYSPERIATRILSNRDFELKHDAKPTWWEWIARWEQNERWIEIGMTLFGIEPPAWGGSPLQGRCDLNDIMSLWLNLRDCFPAVWMHNTLCEIHTPESFVEAIRTPCKIQG